MKNILAPLFPPTDAAQIENLLVQVDNLTAELERTMGENMMVKSQNALLKLENKNLTAELEIAKTQAGKDEIIAAYAAQVDRLTEALDTAIQERDFHYRGFVEMEAKTHAL